MQYKQDPSRFGIDHNMIAIISISE